MFIAHGIELGLVIERMHWIILCATDQFKFLTSDNPLFFTDPRRDAQSPYRGVGLMNATVEVTFPLSRELALFASWNRSHPEGFLQANNNLVKRVNRGTALSAQRFVYASERSIARFDFGAFLKKSLLKKSFDAGAEFNLVNSFDPSIEISRLGDVLQFYRGDHNGWRRRRRSAFLWLASRGG